MKTGTVVTLNGVNAGEVKKVEIDEENRIKVFLTVLKKYKKKIKSDSIAKIVRPLLIGNKQINISTGSHDSIILLPGSVLKSEDSSELIDLISGRSLQAFLDDLGLNPDTSDDSFEHISVREIYNSALSSLVTLNEFQKSFKELGISMKTFSTNIEGLSNNMGNMATSMQSMGELSLSMDNFAKEFNSLNESLNDFEPLTEKLLPFIEKLDILVEALQNNILLRKEIEKIKKEKSKTK